MRRLAEQQYDETRDHATRLIESMRQIEDRIRVIGSTIEPGPCFPRQIAAGPCELADDVAQIESFPVTNQIIEC